MKAKKSLKKKSDNIKEKMEKRKTMGKNAKKTMDIKKRELVVMASGGVERLRKITWTKTR